MSSIKSELPTKDESLAKPDSSVKQLADNTLMTTSKEQTVHVASKGIESALETETKPIPVEVDQLEMKKSYNA